jgi:hypothetical protein
VTKVTSTDYRRPHRPLLFRGANLALGGLSRVGSRSLRASLEESSLLEAAERTTGLLDYGDSSFREPFRKLLSSIESEAHLHPVGRHMVRERLVSNLANRMRIEEQFRRHPELEGSRVSAPIVIVGLQRTGTTLLHRLLAADRRVRSLASWEALAPAPLGKDDRPAANGSPDPRKANAALAERALRYLAPDFFAVHPVEAGAPEEDVLLLDLSFRSTVAEATLRVPSFSRWLEEQDQEPAYRMLERCLRLLQWQRPGTEASELGENTRWVLKTPHHLEWLEVLLGVFPNAKVIWTHRDPKTTVASFCSMVAHGRGVFSDRVDPIEIGQDWGRKVGRMIERAMAARDAAGERYFVDVHYDDLTKKPLEVMKRVYGELGMPYTKDTETVMKDLLRTHTQHRHGVHRYAMEDFGLSARGLDAQFEAYRQRFLSPRG